MSPRVYLICALIAAGLGCVRAPVSPPPLPPQEITLADWPQDAGMRSPQTLREIAEMIAAEVDAGGDMNALIFEWVRQFCILNNWPTPECGPPLHARIKALIINRT